MATVGAEDPLAAAGHVAVQQHQEELQKIEREAEEHRMRMAEEDARQAEQRRLEEEE